MYVNASLSLIGLCALTGAGVAIGSGELFALCLRDCILKILALLHMYPAHQPTAQWYSSSIFSGPTHKLLMLHIKWLPPRRLL